MSRSKKKMKRAASKIFRRKGSSEVNGVEKPVASIKAGGTISTGSLSTSLPEDQDPVVLFQDLKAILDQRRSDAIASINKAWDKVEESLIEEISLAREQSFASLVDQAEESQLPSRVIEQQTDDGGVEVVLNQQGDQPGIPPSLSIFHDDFDNRKVELDCEVPVDLHVSDMEQFSIITPTHSKDQEINKSPTRQQLATPSVAVDRSSSIKQTSSVDRYLVEQKNEAEAEQNEIAIARGVTPTSLASERSDLDRYSVRSDYKSQDDNDAVQHMKANIKIRADDAAFFCNEPPEEEMWPSETLQIEPLQGEEKLKATSKPKIKAKPQSEEKPKAKKLQAKPAKIEKAQAPAAKAAEFGEPVKIVQSTSHVSSLGDTATIDDSVETDGIVSSVDTDDSDSEDSHSLVSAFELMVLNLACLNDEESSIQGSEEEDTVPMRGDRDSKGMVVLSPRCAADDVSLIDDSFKACGPFA